MRLKKSMLACTALALALGMTGIVHAKVSGDAAKELKSTLTPFGALRAGNGKDAASGDGIPAWEGGISKSMIPGSYKKAGQHHPDPYAADKPVFTITGQNFKQYGDKVPKGLQALFQTYPDSFKMPVYQSRRSHSAPAPHCLSIAPVKANRSKRSFTPTRTRCGLGLRRMRALIG